MRLTDGAVGLTGVTKLFGDVLSYMRLFALGLASASLAGTFNNLAAQLAETYRLVIEDHRSQSQSAHHSDENNFPGAR